MSTPSLGLQPDSDLIELDITHDSKSIRFTSIEDRYRYRSKQTFVASGKKRNSKGLEPSVRRIPDRTPAKHAQRLHLDQDTAGHSTLMLPTVPQTFTPMYARHAFSLGSLRDDLSFARPDRNKMVFDLGARTADFRMEEGFGKRKQSIFEMRDAVNAYRMTELEKASLNMGGLCGMAYEFTVGTLLSKVRFIGVLKGGAITVELLRNQPADSFEMRAEKIHHSYRQGQHFDSGFQAGRLGADAIISAVTRVDLLKMTPSLLTKVAKVAERAWTQWGARVGESQIPIFSTQFSSTAEQFLEVAMTDRLRNSAGQVGFERGASARALEVNRQLIERMGTIRDVTEGGLLRGGNRGLIFQFLQKPSSLHQYIATSSPSEVAWGYGELSTRQMRILEQLPAYEARIHLYKSDINVRDLASLTAKTGDEFAMFTLGNRRLIIRGNKFRVFIHPDKLEIF